MKNWLLIISTLILIILILNLVSAGLCKGSDNYYHKCKQDYHSYHYPRHHHSYYNDYEEDYIRHFPDYYYDREYHMYDFYKYVEDKSQEVINRKMREDHKYRGDCSKQYVCNYYGQCYYTYPKCYEKPLKPPVIIVDGHVFY